MADYIEYAHFDPPAAFSYFPRLQEKTRSWIPRAMTLSLLIF
ncbi:hypothetical protein B14911_28100 [Bacillus sp. NRRL B-14911]|uniref:Uncharacterized protein n=1 Tax=Bacillus infantis NRRL B-14911 TaxID=1367477 RepID=U5LAC7_9BACI|nr:hypothetical protein N288_12235 [Bacillus infantis NRRL B-14911]EAR66945.1 hypothetical protein B14911_28100 [Bacillus sp. NRRL B-14911]